MIGAQNVQTDSSGNASFTVSLPSGTLAGQYISATATDPSGNTSEFCLDVQTQGQIDLRLSASAPSSVLAGSQFSYAIAVSNQGTISAQQVLVSDQLPSGVKLVSMAVSQGFIDPTMGSTVQANLGTIQPGATATLTIVVQTSASFVGAITDSATVTSLESDPTPADESATVTTTVLASSDLSFAMTGSPNSVAAGSDLSYAMTASNAGPDDADDTIATFPLPAGVNLVSATGGKAVVNNGQVVVSFGDVPANSHPVTVDVVVQPEIAGTLSVTATVSSESVDPNPSNNTATVTTQVTPSSDLAVTIAASLQPAAASIPFQYTVTATSTVLLTIRASR